jgi:hypothetical protein
MPYIPDLKTVRGKADPAPNWRWVVGMPDLIPRALVQNFPVPYEGLLKTSTIPFGIVDAIEFGMRQIDSDARFGGGARRHFPRFMSVPNMQVTFYEDINYSVTRYIRSWQNLIIDEHNNYGVPDLYKHKIILYAFDYVSNNKPVMVGYAMGCWPTSVSGYSYSYDQSGPVTLTCDFCVDEDVVQVGGGSSIPGIGGSVVDDSLLGQFRSFVQSARNFSDGIRGAADQIMQPVRDARAMADQAIGTVRDVTGSVRQILLLPQTLRQEALGSIEGAQRSVAADFRQLGGSIPGRRV